MSQLFYLVPLLLLISSLLGSSIATAPVTLAATFTATFTAPQLTVTLPAQAIVAGGTQTLHVHLDQSAERTAALVLLVTYPSGVTERSVHAVHGSTTSLAWPVPLAAGAGVASFSLAADGCGCAQKGTVPPPNKLESMVAGTFLVRSAN